MLTNSKIPKIETRIGNNNKLRYILRLKTWTGIKILPNTIEYYLTPLALAIWIMDDGSRAGKGLKLATNNFKFDECNELTNILRNKYNLKVSIHKTGHINQWNLYIHKESIINLNLIIKPSMKYKLNI